MLRGKPTPRSLPDDLALLDHSVVPDLERVIARALFRRSEIAQLPFAAGLLVPLVNAGIRDAPFCAMLRKRLVRSFSVVGGDQQAYLKLLSLVTS